MITQAQFVEHLQFQMAIGLMAKTKMTDIAFGIGMVLCGLHRG